MREQIGEGKKTVHDLARKRALSIARKRALSIGRKAACFAALTQEHSPSLAKPLALLRLPRSTRDATGLERPQVAKIAP